MFGPRRFGIHSAGLATSISITPRVQRQRGVRVCDRNHRTGRRVDTSILWRSRSCVMVTVTPRDILWTANVVDARLSARRVTQLKTVTWRHVAYYFHLSWKCTQHTAGFYCSCITKCTLATVRLIFNLLIWSVWSATTEKLRLLFYFNTSHKRASISKSWSKHNFTPINACSEISMGYKECFPYIYMYLQNINI